MQTIPNLPIRSHTQTYMQTVPNPPTRSFRWLRDKLGNLSNGDGLSLVSVSILSMNPNLWGVKISPGPLKWNLDGRTSRLADFYR